MLRSTSVLVIGSFLMLAAAGCKSAPTPPVEEPTPLPEPVVAAAPVEEEEPETEPVVAEPPKNLEIQRNVIRLKPGIKILFATDSDAIDPASFEILDEVASVMEQNGRLRVRVEGHTDTVGKEAYNQDLSNRRSAAVREYIKGKGIVEDRLESQGCGQGTPVAANDTDENRALNRRVEFVILRRRRVIEPCQLYHPREHRDAADQTPPATDPATTPAPTP